MLRLGTSIAAVLLLTAVEAHARPRAVRPSLPALDDPTLYSVVLQFGSVDVSPGDQRTVGLYKWVCCVYPVPVTADVRYYLDPGQRATLDPQSGLLTIAPDAYAGTSFRIYADIEHGRRLISADVYVDTRASNPLRGIWSQTGEIPCDGTPERLPLKPILELAFHGDRTFSVTWLPFEVYKDYWGFYTFDQPPGRLNMGIRRGNYVPPTFRGEGTYTIAEQGGSRRLTLRGMTLGGISSDGKPDCGAVFVSY
jgi:hypothetical protein